MEPLIILTLWRLQPLVYRPHTLRDSPIGQATTQAPKREDEPERNSKLAWTDDEYFDKWFATMLQSLEEPSSIILDNALYHSRLENKHPTSKIGWNKRKIYYSSSKF